MVGIGTRLINIEILRFIFSGLKNQTAMNPLNGIVDSQTKDPSKALL